MDEKTKNDTNFRNEYIEFLNNMIINRKKYKRISDNESMVIAIDSAWGTGKTTFINTWMENNAMNSTIIKYNAWENDFFEDPFESFVYCIANSDCFNKVLDEKGGIKDLKQNFVELGTKIGKAIFKKKIQNVLDEEIAEELAQFFGKECDNIKKYAEGVKETDNIYVQYEEYKKNLLKFKEILNGISREKEIVIVIDELDRCKPTFAIKLLEIIKHICDSSNIVYIFTIDMEQLGQSVKKVYGIETNASGYLCRFFDYISKMPSIDKKSFLENLIKNNPLKQNQLSRYKNNTQDIVDVIDIIEYYSQKFDLSLRDIETIYNNFRIMEDMFLSETSCTNAYALYFCILILKYRYLAKYNKIFVYNGNDITEIIRETFYNDKYIDASIINNFTRNEKISERYYDITNCNRSGNGFKICNVEESKVNVFKRYENGSIFGENYQFYLDENLNVGNILFCFDMKRWEEIKCKTIKQYIQERMEIFNLLPIAEDGNK